MDQAGQVHGAEPARDVADDPVDLVGRHRAHLVEELPERPALEELHDDIEEAVLHADVVDVDDVGMFDLGERPGLEEQLVDGILGLRVDPDDLDGDGPLQGLVDPAEHFAHGAPGDGGQEAASGEASGIHAAAREGRALLEGPPNPHLQSTRGILNQVDNSRTSQPADGDVGQLVRYLQNPAKPDQIGLAPFGEVLIDPPRYQVEPGFQAGGDQFRGDHLPPSLA